MATLGYIPKPPQDRSVEALWKYTEDLVEALRLLSQEYEERIRKLEGSA